MRDVLWAQAVFIVGAAPLWHRGIHQTIDGRDFQALRMKFAATEEEEEPSSAAAPSDSLRKGLQEMKLLQTATASDSLMRKRLQELLLLKAAASSSDDAELKRMPRKRKRTPTPRKRR